MHNQARATSAGNLVFSCAQMRPRVEAHLTEQIEREPENWLTFARRLEGNFPNILSLYHQLYAGQDDWHSQLEDLLCMTARMWFDRPPDLKTLDETRSLETPGFRGHALRWPGWRRRYLRRQRSRSNSPSAG